VVGIAIGYGLVDGIGVGVRISFLVSMSSRPVLGPTQSPIQWVPGLKRPRREAEHSHPSSAEVKNT
jgi:hypothetical protein